MYSSQFDRSSVGLSHRHLTCHAGSPTTVAVIQPTLELKHRPPMSSRIASHFESHVDDVVPCGAGWAATAIEALIGEPGMLNVSTDAGSVSIL